MGFSLSMSYYREDLSVNQRLRRKAKLSQTERKHLARRYGLLGVGTGTGYCHWCGYESAIKWTPPGRTVESTIHSKGRPHSGRVYFGDLEIDHVVPVSMGGSRELDNLVLACGPCNRSRNNRHYYPPRLGD